jgi:dihydroorotate dehydrogenase electron transfer subunit
MFQKNIQVLWNKEIAPSYYKIGFECDSEYAGALPGQFIMLRLSGKNTPLLPRPFSIHRLVHEKGRTIGIEILYKVVGEFTKNLSRCRTGDSANILGPLGKGFVVSDHYHCIFIVAGGIGVAPMLFLTSFLQQKGIDLSKCTVFLGGKSKSDILCRDDFIRLGAKIQIATEDGGTGAKGLVTHLLENTLKASKPDIIFTCGPWAMLKSVAHITERYDVPCQVSIETIMACGMGVCLGCAVESRETSDRYMHTCTDGPIFDARFIKW